MGKSKREHVLDQFFVDRIVEEYNRYVTEHNKFEIEQDKNYIENKPFKVRIEYDGPIEIVALGGKSKRSIAISFKDNKNIVYTIVTKRHKVWKSPDNFLKNVLEKKNITNVWKEVVDTWY